MGLKPVSVSRLNAYIKRLLQSDPILGNVSVIGEISNLKYHGSGHIYFTLKDETSRISCFFSAEQRRFLRYELSDGMEVTASGFLSLYERGGSYSLNVRDIAVSGTGDLQIAFQQLKDKLQREGLFDAKYKKPLPAFPRRVAVITSPTGAAVRDIVKIIKSRSTCTDILICPCLVQGPEAAADIAGAIEAVNARFPQTDVMIVGRGGGSVEELWAFNEEIVARSIFLSRIPVISAVGHETDITIADFVADRRAETPTAAAQMAVPDTRVLLEGIAQRRRQLSQQMERRLNLLQLQLSRCSPPRLREMLTSKAERSQRILEGRASLLQQQAKAALQRREQRLSELERKLQLKNPLLLLKRGCAFLYDGDGNSIGEAKSARTGQRIIARLPDGLLYCSVDDIQLTQRGEKEEL